MALVKCSECEKEISSKAEFCVHCGFVSDMMDCPECGKRMKKTEYCKNCGYNYEDISSLSLPKSNLNKKNTFALTGFILGFCSILAWIIPIIGYPCTIVGIIFSSISLKSEKRDMAIVGLVLGIIFLIATVINSVAGAIIGANVY